jgi:hypothetical protein
MGLKNVEIPPEAVFFLSCIASTHIKAKQQMYIRSDMTGCIEYMVIIWSFANKDVKRQWHPQQQHASVPKIALFG